MSLNCLITGASRGIGFSIAAMLPKYIDVNLILVARSQTAESEYAELKDRFPRSSFTPLAINLADEKQVECGIQEVLNKFGKVDLLINNAGVFPDNPIKNTRSDILSISVAQFTEAFETNVRAPYHIIQALLPTMIEQDFGRIVNVSSGMSRIAEYDETAPAYRASKRALNGITASVAARCRGSDISCIAVCPGWVKSDMGGANAIRSADEAAPGILWALLQPGCSNSGKFFRDGIQLDYETASERDLLDPGQSSEVMGRLRTNLLEFRRLYRT